MQIIEESMMGVRSAVELLRLHAEHCDEELTIAVVYGAAHMRAVANALHAAHRYLPRDAEWVTVLAY